MNAHVSAKPNLLQYDCTTVAQYTPPPPTPPLYAIHHTSSVMTISCKGQVDAGSIPFIRRQNKM